MRAALTGAVGPPGSMGDASGPGGAGASSTPGGSSGDGDGAGAGTITGGGAIGLVIAGSGGGKAGASSGGAGGRDRVPSDGAGNGGVGATIGAGGRGVGRGGAVDAQPASPSSSTTTMDAARDMRSDALVDGAPPLDVGRALDMDDAAGTQGASAEDGDPVFRALGGALYVVATPLGNLRDITLRALDILRTVDVIAAEDTRLSGHLLRHYGIDARLVSLHAHNEQQRAAGVTAHLAAGRSVALVSDAGTPAVSDPGARLVRAVRAAGHAVVPIPGPNAAIAAISAAGLVAEAFVFLGFLPANAKARRTLLDAVAALPLALVLHEAPHRVRQTVEELATRLGADRTLVLAREVTKRFESITTCTLGGAAAWLDEDAHRTRGEFVLIVDAPLAQEAPGALQPADLRWVQALLGHLPPGQVAKVAAEATGVPRDAIYAELLARRKA